MCWLTMMVLLIIMSKAILILFPIPATFTAVDDVLVDMVKDGILGKEGAISFYDKYKKTLIDVLDGKFELD